MDCSYIPDDEVQFVCEWCGRPPSSRVQWIVPPRRTCTKGSPNGVPSYRGRFYVRHAAIAAPPLSLADLLARLDACLQSECEHLDKGICAKGVAKDCQRLENWFVRLMGENGCELQEHGQTSDDVQARAEDDAEDDAHGEDQADGQEDTAAGPDETVN